MGRPNGLRLKSVAIKEEICQITLNDDLNKYIKWLHVVFAHLGIWICEQNCTEEIKSKPRGHNSWDDCQISIITQRAMREEGKKKSRRRSFGNQISGRRESRNRLEGILCDCQTGLLSQNPRRHLWRFLVTNVGGLTKHLKASCGGCHNSFP